MIKFFILNIFFISTFINASTSIEIDIKKQRLFLKNNEVVTRSYPISSSAYGEGQIENSLQTPYGEHSIKIKIGTNVPKYHFFNSRQHIAQEAKIIHEPFDSKDDFITSRIMWLEGSEEGFNRGGEVDSFKRYIYIHGTHEEGLIGTKASHGCIRMFNHDVIELYDLVSEDTLVKIL
ncbi:L,D-transpeptidase [Gammaproteobacteria bacterium]|nr:L,D-transpeptidase [Gammaproteobacteria bacterium]